jgi:hypothetical protein
VGREDQARRSIQARRQQRTLCPVQADCRGGRALLACGLARGFWLSTFLLHDVGEGPRFAALDRSQRDRPSRCRSSAPRPRKIQEEKREALTWGLETRAVPSIVQTYRRAMYRGASHLSAFNEVTEVAFARLAGRTTRRFGRPKSYWNGRRPITRPGLLAAYCRRRGLRRRVCARSALRVERRGDRRRRRPSCLDGDRRF